LHFIGVYREGKTDRKCMCTNHEKETASVLGTGIHILDIDVKGETPNFALGGHGKVLLEAANLHREALTADVGVGKEAVEDLLGLLQVQLGTVAGHNSVRMTEVHFRGQLGGVDVDRNTTLFVVVVKVKNRGANSNRCHISAHLHVFGHRGGGTVEVDGGKFGDLLVHLRSIEHLSFS